YQEAKRFFDEALSLQKKTGTDILITPQDIQENIQKLYTLKHNGKKIKELYECQTKSRTREHKSKEYVHKVFSLFNWGKGKKKSQNKKSENPHSAKEELFLTGQVCSQDPQYQDNSMEYPLPDKYQSHSQDIPNPDVELPVASHSEINNIQEMEAAQAQSETGPAYEEFCCLDDLEQHSRRQCSYDKPQSHPQDIPELGSKFSGNANV
ncbi:uncharacterized protein LOC111691397, partial [Anoplophora glabripennis]|uniref:uncharacterized protein LOC111691397 n=1 Tax=Anoplophora glabripennis TaxID=217634 RepID=UPI000C775E39